MKTTIERIRTPLEELTPAAPVGVVKIENMNAIILLAIFSSLAPN